MIIIIMIVIIMKIVMIKIKTYTIYREVIRFFFISHSRETYQPRSIS